MPSFFSGVCAWEWSDMLPTRSRGEVKGGVGRGGGGSEARGEEGRRVELTTGGAQAVRRQAVAPALPLQGEPWPRWPALRRTAPGPAVARYSQWRETAGCRAVQLASFTTAKVTDKMLIRSYVRGFVKMMGNGGEPGRGVVVWNAERSKAPWSPCGKARNSHAAVVRRPACVCSPLKMFSFVDPHCHPLLLRKGHKVTGVTMPSMSVLTAFMSNPQSCTATIQNLKNGIKCY